MLRRLFLLGLVALAGCLSNTDEAFAPDVRFHDQIELCSRYAACEPLCMAVFEVGLHEVAACRITKMQQDGAYVRVHYVSDDGGYDFGDGWDGYGEPGGGGGGGGGSGYEDEDEWDDDDDGYDDDWDD
ncbi:MAG: hypothetical protein KF773_23650 [Deltaproteobacteria bacterium]|nr:hypothetical protein [Deltaproteobacteria bacterium]